MGDVVIDVPPESQVHKQVVRKSSTEREIAWTPRCPQLLRRGGRTRHARTVGRFRAAVGCAARAVGVRGSTIDLPVLRRLQPVLRKGEWKVTVA
jgi:uncharacterized 2Fe-2S/4Fe-4S cluster protein (DUF4445 family)